MFRRRTFVALRSLAVCFALALAVSTGYAAPWLPFGPDGGGAFAIVADPADHNHLFVGTAAGWLYESRNSGASWHRLSQVGKRNDLVIKAIHISPSDPRHIVIGAYAVGRVDGGVFISDDSGKTWVNQAEMRGQSVRSLTASPTNPLLLVAGSLKGVFRSMDGGQHWKQISPADSTEIKEVQSVAVDPADPNIIYAGTWHLPWKTVDGGEHWDNITSANGIIDDSDVFSIIIDPKTPATVYASACSGIYKSVDAGAKFTKIQGIPSTARRTLVLTQDPQKLDVVFAGTTEGLWRTIDAGKTWARTTGPEVSVQDVIIDPTNSDRIVITTEHGGILVSNSSGDLDTFTASNAGFSNRNITSLKRDSRHPATLYVGVASDQEWGGVFQSDNGGLSWTQRQEGLDGLDVFALGQSPSGSIVAGTEHGFFRLDAETNRWKRLDERGPAIAAPASAPAIPVAVGPVRSVPVPRNHYAERVVPPVKMTATEKKAAAAKAKLKLARLTPAQRHAQALTAQKKAAAAKSKGASKTAAKSKTAGKTTVRKPAPVKRAAAKPVVPAAPARPVTAAVTTPARRTGFDSRVDNIVTSGSIMLASTAAGLLSSDDDGETWTPAGPKSSRDWSYLAAAKRNVVGASMQAAQFSSDAGLTWGPVRLPDHVTRITAVAVEPSGEIWLGTREGVFVSGDAGLSWTTPKNMYVNSVSSLYYDGGVNRIIMTTNSSSYSGLVFSAQLPQRTVTTTDAGWALRFARPVGDHLVGATLFDGIVIQPKVVANPAAVVPVSP